LNQARTKLLRVDLGVRRRKWLGQVVDEEELPPGHLDLITDLQGSRLGHFGPVQISAVFGSHIVNFTMVSGVDKNNAMPAGDAAILDYDIAIRSTANRINANL
jgi:hypothetical protein